MVLGDFMNRRFRLQLPFALGYLEVGEKLLLEIAEPRGFLEILSLDDLILLLLDLFNFFFEFDYFLREARSRSAIFR